MPTLVIAALAALVSGQGEPDPSQRQVLEREFASFAKPFVAKYCLGCHGREKAEARLDLGTGATLADVTRDLPRWVTVLERLEAREMPPADAPEKPSASELHAAVDWLQRLVAHETARHAGDPGPVLARRLSAAEYGYTIRDLTGVDIQPTREFPVDPANEAGFDNSGESLRMTPALLKKYVAAARLVADQMVLTPAGLRFAPHPVVTDTDRDAYCVLRIVSFYERHHVDLAGYFQAAWEYEYRDASAKSAQSLVEIAATRRLSSKYLATIHSLLTGPDDDLGPIAVLRGRWRDLPITSEPMGGETSTGAVPSRAECEKLRDLVLRLRAELVAAPEKPEAEGISKGSQPFLVWNNRSRANRRRQYAGDPASDHERLKVVVEKQHPELAPLLNPGGVRLDDVDTPAAREYRAALTRFCATIPDQFCVVKRGPYVAPDAPDQQRFLTAGFHLMQGYFRDDQPLCELVLDDDRRRELDELWNELDFIADVPRRQYKDFIFFERAEPPRYMREAEFDFARSEDKSSATSAKIQRLRDVYRAKAIRGGASELAVEAIDAYFREIEASIQRVEQQRLAAEPRQLEALVEFARRAYRRPLSDEDRDELLAFHAALRRDGELSHEQAMRDAVASVLASPRFCYRYDRAPAGPDIEPLDPFELASRLSYFLWASMPDEPLLERAQSGDLREPRVLASEVRRMLRDDRARGLATEFLGNWLDFRRFEEHNGVDRLTFPTFDNRLRRAMFEEPIRFFQDTASHDRSILDLIEARHALVNGPLARHYGMPFEAASDDTWVRVEQAREFGRGGLLPMAVFLTKNSPGLRTSPVKRGYWVVRRLLGQRIPAPPPAVPELPPSERELGELTLAETLVRHREDRNCAACHQRFDHVGLVFEGYGPIGERREKDLGGRAVQTRVEFPDGSERDGVDGLRAQILEQRRGEFVAQFTRKLFAYALGRSLLPSDEPACKSLETSLAEHGYTLHALVESIVVTPQFLNKRGAATSEDE